MRESRRTKRDLSFLKVGGKKLQHNDFLYGYVLWKDGNKSGMWRFGGLIDTMYHDPRGEIIVGFEKNTLGPNQLIPFVAPRVREVCIEHHERDERT